MPSALEIGAAGVGAASITAVKILAVKMKGRLQQEASQVRRRQDYHGQRTVVMENQIGISLHEGSPKCLPACLENIYWKRIVVH